MSKIEASQLCFFKSPTFSWVVGSVESVDPKSTFTCKTKPNTTKGADVETVPKLKEHSIFVVQNAAILDEKPDDLLMLTLLHECTIMHTLNERYFQDVIYTYIGPIVVAFNPFKYTIPWYTDDNMPKYLEEGPQIKKNKPHTWAVAHNTYWEMIDRKADHCILVSGESGAGKTEAVKIAMRYLSAVSCLNANEEQKAAGKLVGYKLMQASPILEGFGNAKTARNDNSSRFGKFMKVQFTGEGLLVGAHTTKYLLEKSRIVTASKEERCYHSFYLLTAGKDRTKHKVDAPQTSFKSISAGGCVAIPGVSDADDYAACLDAMTVCKINAEEQNEIWATVGGILNLLNVEFEPQGEGSQLKGTAAAFIEKAVSLWQVDGAVLSKELTSTTREARGEKFTKNLSVPQAVDTRDALVKALYDELFGWLVERINVSSSVENFGNFIGLLDIFGFEDFEINSFEQLCINLANETLQHHYNTYIFNKDMDECRAEGVDVTQVEFPDNTPCVELITAKMGIIALLDEECALGKGTDEGFLNNICKQHGKHPFFEKKQLAKTSFIVKHYAGDVSYQINAFLDKNRDTLKDDMKMLMRASGSAFIKELLPEPVEKAGKKVTVGGFFKTQLTSLMSVINSTNPHWIRCIKPHPAKKPLMWHGVNVLNQLLSSGIIGTVKVRKAGFPIRIFFPDFLKRFRILKPGPVSDPRSKCEEIINHMKFEKKIAQIGTTRVFLKNEPYTQLEDAIAVAARAFILQAQAWIRAHLAQVTMRQLDFQSNKASILANLKDQIQLNIQEDKERKIVQADLFQDFYGLFWGAVEETESGLRHMYEIEWAKGMAELMDTEFYERDTLDARIKEERAQRAHREASAREYLLEDEETLRHELVAMEDALWQEIMYMARTEQNSRDQCRADERTGRNSIIAEEMSAWLNFIREEQDSYAFSKNAEKHRLAGEWKSILEGVYAQQAERKAEWIADEKFRYDTRRREMVCILSESAERVRVTQRADLPTSQITTVEERRTFEKVHKAQRDHQTAKREYEADKQVDKLRSRKETLMGKEITVQRKIDRLRQEQVTEEKRRWMGCMEDIYKHDALSARIGGPNVERLPLHTHINPPPPHLFSQTPRSTSEEIIAARSPPRSPRPESMYSGMYTPRGEGGAPGNYTPRTGAAPPPRAAPQHHEQQNDSYVGGIPLSPRQPRSPRPSATQSPRGGGRGYASELGLEMEPLFSPVRTRAAAGLNPAGHPVQPMMPQPNPVSPPKLGSWSPMNSPRTRYQDRRQALFEEFGI